MHALAPLLEMKLRRVIRDCVPWPVELGKTALS